MGLEASILADGRRLHLHEGPIDLIIEAIGPGRQDAYDLAVGRFRGLLQELVHELPELRLAADRDRLFHGPVARRMQQAVIPMLATFVTPMAAVAGAVADEILAAMDDQGGIEKIIVNNGGDVAFYLTPGQSIEAAIGADRVGKIVVTERHHSRGVATSGWQGRSHSLGIADAVTVVATNAAGADAAATLIANAVDLPGHPAITRIPARHMAPDSDLGDRLVTEYVGPLSERDVCDALDGGEQFASALIDRNVIAGALLMLQGQFRQVGSPVLIPEHTGDRAYG